jgi:membrane fusion protein (multidrug efflux system)
MGHGELQRDEDHAHAPWTVRDSVCGRAEDEVEGWVEALPGASGAVYSLLPPENGTGNYVKEVHRLPVRIRLHLDQNGYQRLRPGMSVEPKVWLR